MRPLTCQKDRRKARTAALRAQGPRDTRMVMGVTEQACVQDRTMESYQQAVHDFERTMKSNLGRLSARTLDQLLVCYFDRLFLEGHGAPKGDRLWAAIKHLAPQYEHRGELVLPRSMRALRGWRRLVPQKTRRPLPWSIVCAIAMHLALAGGTGMALCWLLMVDCYLRPGEAVALECSQVLPGTRVRHMRETVLLLHPDERGIASKTGEYNESLGVSRSWLGQLVADWSSVRRTTALWDFGLREIRDEFMKGASALGLGIWKPVLYMGRHTGASLDRLEERRSLSEVQKRGRWRTETSVRRYEKRALIQEVYLKLAQKIRAQAHRCERELVGTLRRLVGAHVAKARRAR